MESADPIRTGAFPHLSGADYCVFVVGEVDEPSAGGTVVGGTLAGGAAEGLGLSAPVVPEPVPVTLGPVSWHAANANNKPSATDVLIHILFTCSRPIPGGETIRRAVRSLCASLGRLWQASVQCATGTVTRLSVCETAGVGVGCFTDASL